MSADAFDQAYAAAAKRTAYCPKCSGAMQAGAVECPHCGFDFPLPQGDVPENLMGWLAQLTLCSGMLVASVAAMFFWFSGIAVSTYWLFFERYSVWDFVKFTVLSLSLAIICTALAITFHRVSKLRFDGDD